MACDECFDQDADNGIPRSTLQALVERWREKAAKWNLGSWWVFAQCADELAVILAAAKSEQESI